MPSASVLNLNVPRRARNRQPPPYIINNPVPPVMRVGAMELAHTMAIVMAKKDREKFERPGDVIKHMKKYGAYDFYGTLDLGQADKWIKTVEKAFTKLQLSNKENIRNVYGFIFDKVDDSLIGVQNLYSEALTW